MKRHYRRARRFVLNISITAITLSLIACGGERADDAGTIPSSSNVPEPHSTYPAGSIEKLHFNYLNKIYLAGGFVGISHDPVLDDVAKNAMQTI